MQYTRLLLLALVAAVLSFSAAAQDPIVYPNQGQSAEQADKDKYDCYSWARQETGFDPMAAATATSAPPPQQAKKGGLARGALRGAAVGGIVNGSSGARHGAAAGALVGGLRRSDQNRGEAQAQAQWEQDQAANYQQQRGNYNRAYGACLEGRGYSVR